MISSRLGHIEYFSEPLVYYRQHSSNLVGASSLFKRIQQRIVDFNHDNSIDEWIGSSLRQLRSFYLRYPLPYKLTSMYLDNLFCANPFRRVLSAAYLGLVSMIFFAPWFLYFIIFMES